MGPVEPNALVTQQQQQSQKSKRRSHSNERNSRENSRQKSRRNDRSRSGDRESSSSSSDNDHEDGNGSMDDDDDDDDDASVSDRSSRGSSSIKQTAGIRWDYRINPVGRRIKETKVFCCLNCRYPVLLVGRLLPCKHSAFCLQCANECKNDRRNCPKCNDVITDVEKIEAKNLILCFHGSHPHSQDACLRGYTSQRDLQAHIKRRHEQPSQPGQTRLDSPHQLPPPTHSPSASFPALVVDPQQQQQQQPPPPPPPQVPPPLMTFPPMNVPAMAPPPPLFDMGFRPPNYGLPPSQQFVPSQPPYRPSPYPPNRPFY